MSIIPLQLQELYSDVRPNKNDLDAFVLRSVSYMGGSVDYLHSLFRQQSSLFSKGGRSQENSRESFLDCLCFWSWSSSRFLFHLFDVFLDAIC